MASAIITKSPTLEGQALEIINAIIYLENNLQTNPENLHYVTGQWQVVKDEFSYQGTLNIKILKTIDEDGKLVLEPYCYLIDKASEYHL